MTILFVCFLIGKFETSVGDLCVTFLWKKRNGTDPAGTVIFLKNWIYGWFTNPAEFLVVRFLFMKNDSVHLTFVVTICAEKWSSSER